ncbi:FadR family transcriptional regulator [Candidatus Bipolaricaulota bacterium]|nr:FadR family transcriptional regulator [Candidatus Bipolaricaulota bacterium]
MERVVELIEAGILKPGRKIPSEKQLMTAFRVGRSTLREALRSLVALRVLECHQGKGYFVSTLGPSMTVASGFGRIFSGSASLPEIMEARERIEIALVQLAVARATREDLAELRGIAAELRQAASGEGELLPYTMRVHLSIGRAARNRVLLHLFRSFIPWIMAEFELVSVPRNVDLEMHLRLVDAFLRRDERACLKAVEQHQQFWTRQYQERFHGEG